jgi:hypothetical protein
MPCPGSKRSLPSSHQVVQITTQRAVPAKPARLAVIDHHCDVCGYTGPHAKHVCKGPRPIGWQKTRESMCSRCKKYNQDGVCVLYKSQHPDRDAVISVGIQMPYAACPAGLWPRVEWTCDQCGSVTFREQGVNACQGCGARPPHRVSVPYVAQLEPEQPWEPENRLLVVTMATGVKAIDLLELTGPRMEAYAMQHGADFRVILDDLSSGYPLANKFRLATLASKYDRVLFLDVDVWVRPDAPNIFELESDAVHLHPDAVHDRLSQEQAEAWMIQTCKEQNIDRFAAKNLNSGVVLFSGSQSYIWNAPPLPIGKRHIAEQMWVEANIVRSGVKQLNLDSRWNWQWYFHDFKEGEDDAYFIHLAACPHEERIYRLRKMDYSSRLAPKQVKPDIPRQTYERGSLDKHLIAVTALSEQPHHLNRQSQCLDSWVRYGLSITSVNTPDEISRLRDIYPQVSTWVSSDEQVQNYSRPTQKIKRMAKVAEEIDKPILLINSDIEIEGGQSALVERLKDRTLVVGVRWNYKGKLNNGSREQWGLDAFVITPEMSASLPDLSMGIGKPQWDYWIPLHFELAGYALDFIGDPLFFHEAHEILWNQQDWHTGGEIVGSHYGIEMNTHASSVALRSRWPFPPD